MTAFGIDTIKIREENCKTHNKASYKNSHLVWVKVKGVSCQSLKNSKLIYHRQRRRDLQMT